MKYKIVLKKVTYLFIIVIISGLFNRTPFIAKADVVGDSKSEVRIKNSLGEVVAIVSMQNGEIIVIAKSQSASTNIKWATTGFTITKQPLKKIDYTYRATEGNYHLKGYEDVSTVYSGGYGYLPFSIGEKSSVTNPRTGITTATIKFSAEKVQERLGEDFSTITKNTPIYLHGIFRTYSVDKNGKEVNRESGLNNWKDILHAEWWDRSDNRLDEFAKYFNMKIEFQPAEQDNTLYHYIDGNSKPVHTKELEKKYPGEEVSWSNQPSTKEHDDKQYELYKYVVETKKGRVLENHHIGDSDNCKLEDIQSGKTTVLLGGMNIKLYYREKSGANILIRAVDEESGTAIKDKLYEGTVTGGQNFSRAVDTTINYNGKAYKKLKNFSYTYKNDSNVSKTIALETSKADGPIAFQIPTDVQNSSTITVSAYYKKTVPGTIPITIKAVDEFTGDTLKTLKTDTVSAGADYNKYTISEAPLSISGKTYNFTGKWNWQYKKNTSSAPIITDEGSGTKVSFKAPSADDIKDGITVNVFYNMDDTESDEITLRVTMVSGSGGLIQEISTETVSRGQAISKPITRTTFVNDTLYQYANKWDYVYMTSYGEKIKSGSGDTASFTIPSTTSLGSLVNLRIYYDGEQLISVPEQQTPITLPIDTPSPQGIINGDKYMSSYFNSRNGISTTESQYVHIRTKDYLLGYNLVNKVGKVEFIVPVTMTYNLECFTATPEEYGGPKLVTDVVTDTQYVLVERAYSYWEIEKLEYYLPNSANVYNYSLPDGGVHLTANSRYVNVPSLTTWHSGDIKSHIELPKQVRDGINLTYPETIKSDTSDRPLIEYVDLTTYAYDMTDELMVKNDSLVFGGSVVMTNTPMEKITPRPDAGSMKHSSKMVHDKVLYTEGEVVDALKRNGAYTSNGNVTYNKHPMSVNAYDSTKLFNLNINDVIIHTPVICKPIVHSDNDKYVQVLNPTEGAYHLVLDPDMTLNDFTVRISNHYPHSNRMGYYERDFSKSYIDPDNVSYIARKEGVLRNEMKLPFDVYLDIGDDKDPENDEFIKSGTWIVMGRETLRFYVPMWVKEGTYIAQFRTVAVNGEDRLDNTEETRNTNRNNYVATSTKTFQISGRMYGLTLYDVSDEGNWKEVFRVKNSTRFKYFDGKEDGTRFGRRYNKDHAYYYTVGINNQYGYQNGRHSQYTLPLMNGSHPQWRNIGATKTGYAVRFRIDTIGEMYASGSKIRIVPTFYHVDAEGKNRQLVDIYYDEEFYGKSHRLVKVGEGIDLANLQQGSTGNPYSKIPEDEIRNTAKVMDTTYAKISTQYGPMYSYSDIRLTSQFRTFVGTDYASRIAGLPSFNKVKAQTKQTETNISKYMQRWYGTYKLPTNIHAVAAGYDVKDHLRKHGIDYLEDFWLKDGYIIINFHIVSYDMDGNENLSYTNAYNYLYNGHCSMWVMEGGATEKTDNTDAKFRLYAGDFMFYYTSKKHSDDYMGRQT